MYCCVQWSHLFILFIHLLILCKAHPFLSSCCLRCPTQSCFRADYWQSSLAAGINEPLVHLLTSQCIICPRTIKIGNSKINVWSFSFLFFSLLFLLRSCFAIAKTFINWDPCFPLFSPATSPQIKRGFSKN